MALNSSDLPALVDLLNLIDIRVKVRRKTAADWISSNEVLLAGEWGKETDTGKMKSGDGVTAWIDLDYFGGEPLTLVPGEGISVDATDPENPIISSNLGSIALSGRVADYASLPTTGLTSGDSYFVEADQQIYIWDGTSFPASGFGVGIDDSYGPSDPDFDFVVAVGTAEGPVNSRLINDPMRDWQPAGDAYQVKTKLSPFPSSEFSYPFLNSSSYFQTPFAESQFVFGTGDFSMEAWVWLNPAPGGGVTNDRAILGNQLIANGFVWFVDRSTSVLMIYDGTTVYSSTTSAPLGQWTLLEVHRVSGVLYYLIDGVLSNSVACTKNFSGSNIVRLGALGGANSRSLLGWLHSFRVTKGLGRRTSSYTVPTQPFPRR